MKPYINAHIPYNVLRTSYLALMKRIPDLLSLRICTKEADQHCTINGAVWQQSLRTINYGVLTQSYSK